MKSRMIFLGIAAALLGCGGNSSNEQGNEHGPDPLAYTIYSNQTELFVEFQPLVVGQSTRFAAHFTQLGDNFTSLNKGKVTVSLIVNESGIRQTADQPASPGIYRLALKPTKAGTGKLVFEIDGEYQDKIVIEPVTIHANAEEAAKQTADPASGTAITYLKEQAWKVEFANAPVNGQSFYEVIKASGEIVSAPGDEVIITANANGTVKFSDNKLTVGASVANGQSLFTLVSNTATDNIESKYKEAKANYEKTKADYERAGTLVKDKIVSEKDYLTAKANFESAEIAFQTLSKNYSSNGQRISAPIKGFVKNISVTEGQYVSAGEPLVTVSQNQKLRLRAEVSQKYLPKLASVRTANFKTVYDNKLYELGSLNGKLISYGKTLSPDNQLLPVTFEIDNRGQLVPGSLVEVFLFSNPIANALVAPMSSLVEEQGTFYMYVQTAGESFEKREVKLGGNDGKNVQVLSGIAPGERVVTKGAYQIKLATMSGSVPAHGHEH
jgi:cobalt-zinc-cadmium efflux system membrane fusion protein